MFNKLNGKLLIAVVAILLGVFLFSTFFGPGSTKRTFPDKLLLLDSSSVNAVVISAKNEQHNPYRLELSSDTTWTVGRDGVMFPTELDRVPLVIQAFTALKPLRLAGRDETTWTKFEVTDSLGTLITFESASGKKESLTVGKFSYDQESQRGTSYVRIGENKETYAVDGFLRIGIDQPLNAWRNKLVLQGTKDTWKELSYSYPADSGFVLTKMGNQWAMNGTRCDSASVVDYLETLNNLQSVNFVDDMSLDQSPMYSVQLTPFGLQEIVTIEAFSMPGSGQLLIRSSLNPNSLFSNEESQMASALFKSPHFFRADQ